MKFLVLLSLSLCLSWSDADADPQVGLPPLDYHLQQQQQYLANLATAGRFAYTVHSTHGSTNSQAGDDEDAAVEPPQLPFAPFYPPYHGLAPYQPWGFGQPWTHGGYGGYPGQGYNTGYYPGYGFNPFYPGLPAPQVAPQ